MTDFGNDENSHEESRSTITLPTAAGPDLVGKRTAELARFSTDGTEKSHGDARRTIRLPTTALNRGPGSSIRPLAFLRAFACVSRSFHKLSSGRCKNFKAPRADVIGHHPYSFFSRPTRHSPNRDDAAIGDGRRLLRFLDRLVKKHRLISTRGGKLQVHYTEFGYQTDPPDPYAGISLKKQDRWLQEAARVAWATPRVRSFAQFRLSDGPKLPGNGFDAWREFQTGLLFHDMRPKPSYLSFRDPFVVNRLSRRNLRLWGQVRPGGRHDVQIGRASCRERVWTVV